MSDLRDLCTKHEIFCTSVQLSRRHEIFAQDWARDATHWRVTVKRQVLGAFYEIVCNYSMGSGHTGQPEIADVLGSLIIDAHTGEMGVDEYISEFGVEIESTKDYHRAVALVAACQQTRQEVLDFLEDDFETFSQAEH